MKGCRRNRVRIAEAGKQGGSGRPLADGVHVAIAGVWMGDRADAAEPDGIGV